MTCTLAFLETVHLQVEITVQEPNMPLRRLAVLPVTEGLVNKVRHLLYPEATCGG